MRGDGTETTGKAECEVSGTVTDESRDEVSGGASGITDAAKPSKKKRKGSADKAEQEADADQAGINAIEAVYMAWRRIKLRPARPRRRRRLRPWQEDRRGQSGF